MIFARQLLLISVSLFLVTQTSYSAIVRGTVLDKNTKEPLVGATVLVKDTKNGSVANLEGEYAIKLGDPGSYTLVCSFVGYQPQEQSITIRDSNDKVVLNFAIEETGSQLNEVVVTGSLDRGTEEFALKTERNADNILTAMSSKTIQLMPDITVGNILQRVSGVSIVRNASGDGQYAIIRGMDKRYNYTLLNGIKVPSPDNKNRYVPLDIFPSDLLERLEVVKSLTPSMEGDAIGGAMNMVMKSAPSQLTISATTALGYSNIFNSNRPFIGFNTNVPSKSPEALYGPNYQAKITDFGVSQLQYKPQDTPINSLFSFSIGNRVLNRKLGLIASLSYQNIYRGTNSVFYLPDEPAALPYPNTYLFQELQIRQFSNQQKRLGAFGKAEYSFNKNNKISLSAFYAGLDEAQHRNYYNPLATGGGLATNDVHDRSRYTEQKIYNGALRGDHFLFDEKYKLDWTLAYSQATSNTPAWSDMNVRYRFLDQVLQSKELLPVQQRWTNNNDQDQTAMVNLTRTINKNFELMAGGLTRFKTRDNVFTSYELNTLLTDGSGNYQAYTSIDKATFIWLPATSAYANPNDPNNYNAKENISAYYIQAKYNFNPRLQVLGGVRNENTYQEYHSQLTIYKPGRDGKVTYSDLLPSVHFKYALANNQNLRLSYYAAISRPNYFEFVPTEISGDVFTEAGNYAIQHTTADNFDLRYELFGTGRDQVLAGLFYKSIKNPIEYGFVPVTVSTSNVVPQNYGTATNYGFELVVSKFVGNFGINANYTYTNSSIVQAKKYKETVPLSNGSTTIVNSLQNQTRPLQGQSDHIANISLLYKNAKLGFDVQFSWVYTGRRINIVSPYKDLDYWQRAFSQLDFSAEKRIYKDLNFFVKITNLLDAALITEVINENYLNPDSPAQDSSDRIVVQKDEFHQTFLGGLRYKFQNN